MNLNLENKVAVVCGSTQGIGKAAAIEMASMGASLVLIARNEEKLIQTIAELPTPLGQKHTYLQADFSKPDQLKETLDSYVQSGNSAHILVNNTGGPKGGPIREAAIEEFYDTFTQHLICNHILVQALYPLMKENGYGRIINITSSNGAGASEFTSHYQAAKAAQHSFTKSCALTFRKDGITINSVSPSTVITKLFFENDDNYKKYLGRSAADELARREVASPKGLVTVEEVARVVSFLANDASGSINGEVIGI
jgi:3-oxoacyl-[acyl-carrier protein] reductase